MDKTMINNIDDIMNEIQAEKLDKQLEKEWNEQVEDSIHFMPDDFMIDDEIYLELKHAQ